MDYREALARLRWRFTSDRNELVSELQAETKPVFTSDDMDLAFSVIDEQRDLIKRQAKKIHNLKEHVKHLEHKVFKLDTFKKEVSSKFKKLREDYNATCAKVQELEELNENMFKPIPPLLRDKKKLVQKPVGPPIKLVSEDGSTTRKLGERKSEASLERWFNIILGKK